MGRCVLVMLFRLGGTVIVIVIIGLGTLGWGSWKIMIKDRFVIFLAREEIRRCSFCSRLERVVFVVVGSRLLVFVGRTTSVSATMANAGLPAEVMRPAFRKLSAWDVGMEDLVDGSVV
jgi:hypothetical protein